MVIKKLILVAGPLWTQVLAQDGEERKGETQIISNTRIVPGGKALQQSFCCVENGYGVVLLARVGDDLPGKEIRETLNAKGISTQFIERGQGERSGFYLEIMNTNGEKKTYFDPGANMERGKFTHPLKNYLPLCDTAIVNEWIHPETTKEIFSAAAIHGVNSVYVTTIFPDKTTNISADYLFVENIFNYNQKKGYYNSNSIKKGIFNFHSGNLSAYTPDGENIGVIQLNPEITGDWLLTRMASLIDADFNITELKKLFEKVCDGGTL